jgi:VanZ family protein
MVLIYALSAQSDPAPAITSLVWDKLLHAVEYGVLALLFCRALDGEGVALARTSLVALLLTVLYAATDEYHQSYVPLRTVELQDWIADAAGGLAAAATWLAFARVSTVVRRPRPLRR